MSGVSKIAVSLRRVNLKSFLKTAGAVVGKVGAVTGLYKKTVGLAEMTNEIVVPFSEGARQFKKILLPASAFTFIHMPIQAFSLGQSVTEAVLAPGVLKVLPSLKVTSGVGSITDSFVSLIGVLEEIGVKTIPHFSAVAAPLGAVAMVLQGTAIGISAWSIHELNKQWDKVTHLLGKDRDQSHEPNLEEYSAAIQFLTKKSTTRKEKFHQLFFGLLNDSQKAKVQGIFEKFKQSKPEAIQTTMGDLKKHVIHKKVQHAITIALILISAVGLMLLLFTPTPLAPIAWGILVGASAASLGVIAYNYFANRRLNQLLLHRLESS